MNEGRQNKMAEQERLVQKDEKGDREWWLIIEEDCGKTEQ